MAFGWSVSLHLYVCARVRWESDRRTHPTIRKPWIVRLISGPEVLDSGRDGYVKVGMLYEFANSA